MEEDAGRGGDPRHRSQEARPEVEEEAWPKVFGHAHCFIVAHMAQNVTFYYRISTRIVLGISG